MKPLISWRPQVTVLCPNHVNARARTHMHIHARTCNVEHTFEVIVSVLTLFLSLFSSSKRSRRGTTPKGVRMLAVGASMRCALECACNFIHGCASRSTSCLMLDACTPHPLTSLSALSTRTPPASSSPPQLGRLALAGQSSPMIPSRSRSRTAQ